MLLFKGVGHFNIEIDLSLNVSYDDIHRVGLGLSQGVEVTLPLSHLVSLDCYNTMLCRKFHA